MKQQPYQLLAIARALFELIRDENNLDILQGYRRLVLEAASTFTRTFSATGALHEDLGIELIEYIDFKLHDATIDGPSQVAAQHDCVESIIIGLEQDSKER